MPTSWSRLRRCISGDKCMVFIIPVGDDVNVAILSIMLPVSERLSSAAAGFPARCGCGRCVAPRWVGEAVYSSSDCARMPVSVFAYGPRVGRGVGCFTLTLNLGRWSTCSELTSGVGFTIVRACEPFGSSFCGTFDGSCSGAGVSLDVKGTRPPSKSVMNMVFLWYTRGRRETIYSHLVRK